MDSVLFVTPEYNRDIPGSPEERHRLGQPSVGAELVPLVSLQLLSVRRLADRHCCRPANLRSILSFCNSLQMNAPEAYIQFTPGLITEDGEVTDETTEIFLQEFMEQFEQFMERVFMVLPRASQVS